MLLDRCMQEEEVTKGQYLERDLQLTVVAQVYPNSALQKS